MVRSSGFGVILGIRVMGLGFGVQGSGAKFRIWD